MKTAVSTLAFIGKSAEEIISLAKQHGWAIEFSSGMPYRQDMEKIFTEAKIERYAHNYFPAPEKPFVLNLASSNNDIRNASIKHCIKGIELSGIAGSPFFSAHAGFCIDPKPSELGNRLVQVEDFNREKHWELFISSVKNILAQTENTGIDFLIENNVLAKMNVYDDGSNPLLCVEDAEILKLTSEINNPRLGILLDTAHLKVSANTLGFDKDKAVTKLIPVIQCIHHSDNDGVSDTNQLFDSTYWFLKHMKHFGYHITKKETRETLHVIEVKKLNKEQVSQQLNILHHA
ncbi:MAG TPA: TIM barrel protein [Nitrosopumilaceae archaeon]|nr:TIM barrel protein [Nitrosopumilaceae archaeon]